MLTDEVIDEDIEALLYAQVYYGKSDTIQLAVPDQVDNISDKDETVSSKIQEPDKLSEDQIQENNLNFKEHQEGNKDEQVDIEESQDQSTCNPSITKLISNPTHITGASEEQDNFEVEPRSQSEVSQQQYLQVPTTAADTVQTENEPVQVTPSLAGTSNQQLLNNITINQYICPGKNFLIRLKNFKATIIWSKKCQKSLRKYQKGKLNERDFFKLLKRTRRLQKKYLKKKEEIKKAYFEKQQKIAPTEIVCLSDSDNSDLEIVSIEAQSIAMKKAGNDRIKTKKLTSASPTLVEGSSEDDDDDAIIYVEPPPVPVINVEDGTDSEVEPSEETSAEVQDDASNDFLAPTNTSEQFNFSLHGSEFQNAEFVRPTDPTDAYETESSTTTSDFNKESNREFSNSVKTIVFDEVDFPREDIFEGSNLDKFGEMITPQRDSESNLDKINEVQVDHNVRKSKRPNPRTSSESSSESEYDARGTHHNLPDLSPMIEGSNSPKKNRKNKIKPSLDIATKDKQPELKSRNSKKSKQNISSEGYDGILDAESSENMTDNLNTKSKKRTSGVVVEEYGPKKRIKKKKTADRNVEELEATMDETVAPETSNMVTSTPKRPKKDMLTIDQPESPKKKNKKKKKQTKNVEDNNASVSEEETAFSTVQQGAEDTNKKKSKKRKVNSETADQSSILECSTEKIIEPLIPTEKDDLDDGSKKKVKKRKQRLSYVKEGTSENVQATADAENEIIAEESIAETSEVSLLEETNSRRKSKRNKQNSSNKTNSKEVTENIEQSNKKSNNNNVEEESLDPSKMPETHDGENVLGESQEDEEDVVIIEPAIPVHTIESSDSEDDDFIMYDDLSDGLKLANITAETNKSNDSRLDKFDIEFIKSNMSDDPNKWKILSVDQYNISISKKGPRCHRCRQFGHLAVNCTNKPSIPSCTLCGYEGHQEPRCPNKVCFTCGKPGNYSTVFCYKCSGQRSGKCHLCKLTGHLAKYCPDLWRRYYLTIKEGPLIAPKKKNSVIPRSKQWCSGCARRGHLEFECYSYKWIREYPTSSPHIFDYGDVYETEKKKEDRLPSSDLRIKLLQSRSRNNRAVSQHENQTDSSQNVDNEDPTRNESSNAALETPAEATATKTVESSALDGDIGNPVRESAESTNIDVSQPPNDIEVSVDVDENVNNFAENQNQGRIMHQVSSTTDTTFAPQEMNRSKKNRESRWREKLNPLSVWKPPAAPAKFTPYHSVLNPYSLLESPTENTLNVVPPNQDIGAPFIDTLGAHMNNVQNVPAYNLNMLPSNRDMGAPFDTENAQAMNNLQNAPALGLFNQIPNNLLAQQVASLMNAFSGYQQTNQMQYDFPQDNMYQGPDYNMQVQSSRYNWHDMNYFDVAQPVSEGMYFNNVRGRDDGGFTHMNYETNYMHPNRHYHRDAWTDENFRSRNYSDRNTPYQTSSETFVPLQGGGQEDIDTYKPRHLSNVEEATAKKFTTSGMLALRAFISTELKMLDKVKNVPARIYKKKLSSIDQLKKVDMQTDKTTRQIYVQYKHINMFLFGLQGLADGKEQLNFLRNFVRNPGRQLRDVKRDALLNAYGYIFGGEHPNFNYRKYLNALTVGRGR